MENVVRVGIGVFVVKNKKFLIGFRKGPHGHNTWALPGGHLEFGESIEKGAAREVFEESLMKVKNQRILGVTNDVFKEENKHYITIWVVCDWKSGKEKIMEPDKNINWEWVNFKSLPKPLFLPLKNLLKSDVLDRVKREISKGL